MGTTTVSRPLTCEDAQEMLFDLDERYGEDGPPWVYAAAEWARSLVCDAHAMRSEPSVEACS